MLETLYGSTKIQVPNNIQLHPESSSDSFVKLSQNSSENEHKRPSVSNLSNNNIDTRPRLTDGFGNKYLVDSGSMTTVVRVGPEDKVDPDVLLEAVDGSTFDCYGKKEIEVRINRKTYKIQAVIAKVKTAILGWDFIRKYNIDMVWNEFGDAFIRDKKSKIEKLLDIVEVKGDEAPRIHAVRVINHSPAATSRFQIFGGQVIEAIDSEKEKKKEIHDPKYIKMLDKYPDILKPNFKQAKTKHGIEHKILTSGPPCKARTRPLMPGSPKAVQGREAWMELVDLGIVQKVPPGTPVPWSSALHLQPKASGGWRPCSDFRAINSQTEPDGYPLPNLRHFTHKLKGSTIFSKIDLVKAFHQIPIAEEDQMKTATKTPWGVYFYKRLAMGLSSSAQSFQRLLDHVLDGVEGCFIYLDDIMLYASNLADHDSILEEVLKRLDGAGLSIALDKCLFAKESIDYLGYKVSKNGIKPLERKIECIKKFPVPTKQKELLHYLGAINYYRASLGSLKGGGYKKPRTAAEVLMPLYQLATCQIGKNTSFKEI